MVETKPALFEQLRQAVLNAEQAAAVDDVGAVAEGVDGEAVAAAEVGEQRRARALLRRQRARGIGVGLHGDEIVGDICGERADRVDGAGADEDGELGRRLAGGERERSGERRRKTSRCGDGETTIHRATLPYSPPHWRVEAAEREAAV